MNTPLRRVAASVAIMFFVLFAADTWIQYVRAGWIDARPGNARTLYKSYSRERQPIILAGRQVAVSKPSDDDYRYLRTYPEGPLYAPATGYFSVVYGATGIESATGPLLAGTADRLFYRRIQDLLTGQPAKGATVELTLNAQVQKAAWDALGRQRGAVVALDPKTGDILAMVSRPSYDPNKLATHDGDAAQKAWTSLNADPNKPTLNRTIKELYQPGSVFKVITAAAALESGDYDVDTQVPGPAVLDLPQTSKGLPNDFPGPCGPNDQVSLIDALTISCNTAFGSMGMTLGEQALTEQANKFGFGQEFSTPLTVVPSKMGSGMSQAQVAQSAIGQYSDVVTPMQMAMVAAGIANGGVVMKPNLIRQIYTEGNRVIEQPRPDDYGRAVSRQTASKLTEMMTKVVTDGTGKRAQIDGVTVAGKTGTAENGAGRPPHAWFISFAPAEDPKIAVAVLVENGGSLGDAASGGKVAAPIAKQVMEAVIKQ